MPFGALKLNAEDFHEEHLCQLQAFRGKEPNALRGIETQLSGFGACPPSTHCGKEPNALRGIETSASTKLSTTKVSVFCGKEPNALRGIETVDQLL